MEENSEAYVLWQHVKTQWRTNGFGLVGLDYPAVRAEARAIGIYLSHGLMSKIRALEHYELERQGSGNETGSDPQGRQGGGSGRQAGP